MYCQAKPMPQTPLQMYCLKYVYFHLSQPGSQEIVCIWAHGPGTVDQFFINLFPTREFHSKHNQCFPNSLEGPIPAYWPRPNSKKKRGSPIVKSLKYTNIKDDLTKCRAVHYDVRDKKGAATILVT